MLSAMVATQLIGFAQSWKAEGHLIIARIAYDKLQAENPSALDNVNKEFKALQDYSSALTVKEGDYPFVECATLADDIRMKGGQWQE